MMRSAFGPITATIVLWLAASVTLCEAAEASTAKGFIARSKGTSVTLPAHAKPGSGVIGQFDAALLNAPQVSVMMPDGRTITAHQAHLSRGARHVTWRGAFLESPGDALTLTTAVGVTSGTLTYRGETYELSPADAGMHLLYAVDPLRLPPVGPLNPAAVKSEKAPSLKNPPVVGQPSAAEGMVVHDLLVVATTASRERHGASLESMIRNAVATANAAYRAGEVGILLNLVGVRATTVVEQATAHATLDNLRASSEIAALRDALGADLVMAITENTDCCGLAYFQGFVDPQFAPFAFGITHSACLSGTTLAHEIGHNQGLAHDRETSGPGAQSSKPYAFGFRNCANGSRDIMSYACIPGSATLIHEFSNPRRIVDGRPFGVDYALDPANAADAVRALNEAARIVAGFRAGTGPLAPPAPSGLTASATGPSRASLSWTDNAADELGFLIERTPDGVNWAEVARVDPNVTTYTDLAVRAGSYTYRVLAFNSAGANASNQAHVTVVEAPPAPLYANAQNIGRKTAQVTWAPSSGATLYEIRRERWAKVKVTQLIGGKSKTVKTFAWVSPTHVGTVPAAVGTSLHDTGIVGMHRYSVRAANDHGTSAWVNTSTVNVAKK